jgi:hypothetical protein
MASVPCKPRARLTQDQAVDVFTMRNSSSSAVIIANRYGVSEKAIRDIWKGRTWSMETGHLDTSRTVVLKKTGRPRGSTDQKPRKKRFAAKMPTSHRRSNIPKAVMASGADLLQEDRPNIILMFGKSYKCKKISHVNLAQKDIEGFLSSDYRQEPNTSTVGAQVDAQLFSWTETLWISSQNPDPFRDDWAPMPCPFF